MLHETAWQIQFANELSWKKNYHAVRKVKYIDFG